MESLNSRSPVRISAAVLAVIMTLLISACSSDPAESDDGNDSDMKLRFFQAGETLTYIPQLYATAAGLFEKEGLDIEYLPITQNSTTVAQGLIAGDADVASFGTTAVVSAVAAKQDLTSIAVVASKPTMAMSLTTETVERLEREGVTPESPIEERVAALDGLTLGALAPGSSTDLVLRSTLSEYGVSPQDVTIRPFASSPDAVAATRAGQLDGYASSIPDGLQLIPDGAASEWINWGTGDVPKFDDFPYTAIVVSKDFLKQNKEPLEAFVRALAAGFAELKANPEKVKTALKEEFFEELDAELYDVAFDAAAEAYPTFAATESGYEDVITLVEAGTGKEVNVTTEDVYDGSIAESIEP